jgi:hypothetical protein
VHESLHAGVTATRKQGEATSLLGQERPTCMKTTTPKPKEATLNAFLRPRQCLTIALDKITRRPSKRSQ